jgi:hypothetical protein
MRASLWIALALLAAIVGCGENADPPPPPAAPEPGSGIVYQRSGGFGGIFERLVIEGDGSATLTSSVAGEQAKSSFELGDEQLESLVAALDESGLSGIDAPSGPSGCSDCFEYVIAYAGHRISFDQVEAPPEIAPVLAELAGIVSSHG